ncbi:hypothetical protein M5D96_010516 [Drosophila gunungcola]|uniref:AAA+ ATPase domain-containing protein n=1 Tax=Drosophila gunungcola TaxID=103775 RepID=A0A9P9YGT6_9MUSC|nr:hypothetical protein M5D96_010516 [Drosophila gunungcola]
MSFDLNHKFWVSTRKEIGQLIKKQNRLKKIEPPQEKAVSFKIFAELYVLYVELVEKLGFIYHNTFQVQKRALVRVLVESATQQLMKLKEELKDLEMSEYIYIDKALIARKLTPRDLVIWRSPQFLYRRPLDIQNIIADNRLYMNEEEKEEKAAQDWVPVSEAVKLIQAHERARQARVYKSNINYEKTENFHPYPDPVKKGTVLVVIDETMTPMEFQQTLGKKPMTKEEKKKLRDKEKKEKKKKKEKLKLIKMKEAKRRKKLRDAGIIDIGYELTASQPIEKIEETMKTYAKDWRNVDEYLNKNHDPIKEWVTEDELVKIHQEVRGLVDEYMRVEYELLREALAKDNNEKYKALKVKYPKKKKNRKKKKPKDMTGDRTLESLYHELKDGGIIEEVSHKDFDEFIADFNFVADDTRNEDDLTTWGPAKGDIKMVIQESMLGMGEFNIPKPKSLLLIGPLNSGKKLLCQIIASELDAVFMNLSPEKTYKYADDLKYFLHVVVKVARAFQPTIMFFDEAHRLFWKKIPPEAVNIKPRLLGPSIASKILKPLKKNDKIVVVGTSSMPWAAKGGIKRAFQKVLLIPKCDYGTSFLLWLELMTENAPDDMPEYAYSALARVLQAYNSGDINDNINQTLSIDRKMRLKNEALDPNEFLEYFISKNEPPILPPEEKLMVKFNKWFGKSNKLQKLRNSYIAQKLAKASKRK